MGRTSLRGWRYNEGSEGRMSPKFENQLSRLAGKPLAWVALVGLLFGVPLARGLLGGRPPAAPPLLQAVPDFRLVDERGPVEMPRAAFVAALLCLRCGSSTARQFQALRELQQRTRNLGDSLRIVVFADDAQATSLTALRETERLGPRVSFAAGVPPELRALFSTPSQLLLVDSRRRLRGRYAASELAELLRDTTLVVNGG
jgi:hypothetical protein